MEKFNSLDHYKVLGAVLTLQMCSLTDIAQFTNVSKTDALKILEAECELVSVQNDVYYISPKKADEVRSKLEGMYPEAVAVKSQITCKLHIPWFTLFVCEDLLENGRIDATQLNLDTAEKEIAIFEQEYSFILNALKKRVEHFKKAIATDK